MEAGKRGKEVKGREARRHGRDGAGGGKGGIVEARWLDYLIQRASMCNTGGEATENVVASDDISPPASTPAEAVMMEKEAKDADTHGEKTLDI
jgi:hypothetical protein